VVDLALASEHFHDGRFVHTDTCSTLSLLVQATPCGGRLSVCTRCTHPYPRTLTHRRGRCCWCCCQLAAALSSPVRSRANRSDSDLDDGAFSGPPACAPTPNDANEEPDGDATAAAAADTDDKDDDDDDDDDEDNEEEDEDGDDEEDEEDENDEDDDCCAAPPTPRCSHVSGASRPRGDTLASPSALLSVCHLLTASPRKGVAFPPPVPRGDGVVPLEVEDPHRRRLLLRRLLLLLLLMTAAPAGRRVLLLLFGVLLGVESAASVSAPPLAAAACTCSEPSVTALGGASPP
jgi:hypothetical protein